MSLNSALEDLRATTLKALSGTLRKVEYLAELRGPQGEYVHWGLAQVHGESAACRALQQAHQSLVSSVLCTPLKLLVGDLEQSSKAAGFTIAEYSERLRMTGAELLPPDPDPASLRHLNSVLRVLSILAKNQTADATHQAS